MFTAVLMAGLVAGSAPTAASKGPHWSRRPSVSDMLKVYPEQAFRWSVSGEAVIDCAVTSDGHLEGCAVASESPQGAGFGEAAVKLGRKFQMDLGAASGGGHVQIPIHFNISN